MGEIQKFLRDLFRINYNNYDAKYEIPRINIKWFVAKKQNLQYQFFIVQRLSLILKIPCLPIIRAQVHEIAKNFLTRPSRKSVQNFRTLASLEVLFLKFHAAAATASPQQ